MYKHILIGTDGSELAEKGLLHGISLAKSLSARLTIVHVTQPFITAYAVPYEGGVFYDESAVNEYEASTARTAQSVLDDGAKAAEKHGLACDLVHIKNRHPAEGIVEAAEERGCDLIVMASHGRRGVQRFLLGSQTTEVLTMSQIAVLVVR